MDKVRFNHIKLKESVESFYRLLIYQKEMFEALLKVLPDSNDVMANIIVLESLKIHYETIFKNFLDKKIPKS